jgi:hypothetical protein
MKLIHPFLKQRKHLSSFPLPNEAAIRIEQKSMQPLYLRLLLFKKNVFFIILHFRKEGTALSALEATAETPKKKQATRHDCLPRLLGDGYT